nr:glutamine-synthetase adenylyltransferase [Tropicimonas sp. IMCC34043]
MAAGLPPFAPEIRELLLGAGGCSSYLRGLIQKEAEWLSEALERDPGEILPELTAPAALAPQEDVKRGLRRAKGRLALYTALADLAGVWSLREVTEALTVFADYSVDRALKTSIAIEIEKKKLPGLSADAVATGGGMFVLAMGKMGALELNYSSDIDLICLFDETRFADKDYLDARATFIRATRRAMAILSDKTEDGYVWRTDLRLRPDPSVTPVCLSMDAAERYYESVGRAWERAAFIKARPCAGDIDAGERFLEHIRPFVWRRHLDFAAIQDAYDMRLKIRAHRGQYETGSLTGRNVKLGPGGIREIEFFTQTQQIIAGGRDPDLRVRGTVQALSCLSEAGWIPAHVAAELSDHYSVLREIEHRLQMVSDAQTQILPTNDEGFDRIARMCGEADTARFKARLQERLTAVRDRTEEFFAPGLKGAEESPAVADPEIVERWRGYPALRSSRAQAIFERLKPDLLARLNAAPRPEEALSAFDGFLSGLPAGVQLFSMFEANPNLRALIVDIAATAPALARYLSRNSQVLDAVIGGSFFDEWPGPAALSAELSQRLSESSDYERQLDAARHWHKEWHFRIGVHLLRGVIDVPEAGRQYADLAEAVLKALLPVVAANFARAHGPLPGRGGVALGMGSLGAGWINSQSDLDLIMIYDAAGIEASEGPRPLSVATYYARLTKAIVTALSAPTAEGKLYEVDMRLRPSGKQGPVATALSAFESYQRTDAWTWEHLALTRARPVAGSAAVVGDVERIRSEVLCLPRDPARILADVRDMRARLAEAKAQAGPFDVKSGPGGLQDIELAAQTAALLQGSQARTTARQLLAAAAGGWLTTDEADQLTASYRLARSVQSIGKLIVDGPFEPDSLGLGGWEVMARETGAPDVEALIEMIAGRRQTAAEIVDHMLARTGPQKVDG